MNSYQLCGRGAREKTILRFDGFVPEALLEDLHPLSLKFGALLGRPRLVAVAAGGRGEELEEDLDETGAVQLEGGDVALVGEDVGELVQGGDHALLPSVVMRTWELKETKKASPLLKYFVFVLLEIRIRRLD